MEKCTDHDSTSFTLEKSKKNEECCSEVFPSGFWTESKKLLSLTWPIVIDIFREIPVGTECILIHFQTLTQVLLMLGPVSLVFCAHLGSQEQLDGAALAISVRRELNISHDRMFQFDLPVCCFSGHQLHLHHRSAGSWDCMRHVLLAIRWELQQEEDRSLHAERYTIT